jgi:hypothetical protein
MTKNEPNSGNSVVTYIFELGLKGNLETYKKFIYESVIHVLVYNKPKTMKFEWYLSEDEACATLFEMFEDRDGEKLHGENLLASPLIGPF